MFDIVPPPAERVAITELMNRDLNRVSVWCGLWGMKLNASKTKTMIVTRSSTVHLQSADLVILRVSFNAKMTFENHLRSGSSAAAQRLGIMKKSWQVFHDRLLLLRSFWSFVLLLSSVLRLSNVLRFRSIAQQCGARLPILILNYRTELSGVLFFSWWCFGVQPCPSSICGSVVPAI